MFLLDDRRNCEFQGFPFAPPDVPQPRPGNLEIRNCGDHQVETCQIGCGFGHDVENQRGSQYNLESHRQVGPGLRRIRSEEHTSELQSLMRNSYDVFCMKKKNETTTKHIQ